MECGRIYGLACFATDYFKGPSLANEILHAINGTPRRAYVSDLIQVRKDRRDHMVAVREQFFSHLVEEWSRPPENIDEVMGQSDYFIAPDEGKRSVSINDPARGLLVRSFSPPEGWGKNIQFFYSIWMAGDWIRYGVLIQGDTKLLATFSSRNECTESLERVWDRPATMTSREGGLLIEWRFEDKDFYDDYLSEDRYLQVARHLHFQLGHSIHEAFVDVAFSGPME